MEERLYKILNYNATSQYAFMDWKHYLPRYKWNKDFTKGEWKPGKWLKVSGDLRMCSNGIHLTCYPLRWQLKNGRIFLTEYRGQYLQDNTDKVCFREVRLLCELGIDSISLEVKIWKLINSSANLRSADLRSANLHSADLRSANLHSANLRYANLHYANLSSANLRSADLRSANLRSADLSSANLRYANLSSADLRSANLRYANLSSANLRSADLRSANLHSADHLSGCWIDKDPKITGYRFDNGRLWSK